MRSSKEKNPFLLPFRNQYLNQFKSQATAKQSLFEVSENESQVLLQLSPSTNTYWSDKFNNSQQNSTKPIRYLRKTVHFRPSVEGKYLVSNPCPNNQNLEESMIQKLKNILKKLQSPQKRKSHKKYALQQKLEEEKREEESWECKFSRKNNNFIVENLFEAKSSSIRTNNHVSKQKKSAKILNYYQRDSPMRKNFSREKCLNVTQFADQIKLYRQARNKRTLKNILS